MCGIAGFFTPGRPAGAQRLKSMCDRIVHRGPDDAGYYTNHGCAIGMRRLSVIDLATGHQPIANEDESVWIVFNGEIYNFQELREGLIQRGHRFRTRSDTETILHLYEEEGEGALKRLRGMFGIAIWDARRRSLLLARDRFGKKPLYYSLQSDGLYFGSELKCLLAAGIDLDIDPEAFQLYFQFNYIPDPWSPYRQVRKLPPGGWLRYTAAANPDGKAKVEQGRYWKLPPPAVEESGAWTPAEAARQIRDKFDESVGIRLVSDVPLGAFLSGGIDSSSVVASMALQMKEPVKTFSIGFEESAFNELPYARQVADFYHTDHHELIVRPDSINLVETLVQHFDEPFADSSAIPTYLVSQFARQHVTVALTGDGGDELFGGYESFFAVDRLRRLDRLPQAVRSILSALADRLPYSAYGKNYLRMISRPNDLERYFELNYTPYFLRKQLLSDQWMAPADAAYLRRTFADCLVHHGADALTEALYFEATAKLTGDMLVKVDRTSMASSLEVRCPLLDHELAELAMRIPRAWKLRNGRGKMILIDAIKDRLPPDLLNRPKKGFGVPLTIWMRTSLRDYMHDHLLSAHFLGRDMVSEPFVRHLLSEHASGRRDNSHWLWMLLMLERWFSLCGTAVPVR